MKIRSGFVSNSSSSSFILKGFLVSKENVSKRKLLEVLGFDFNTLKEAMEDYDYKSEDDAIDDLFYEFVYELRDNLYVGTSTEDGNPSDDVYMIGNMLVTLDEYCDVDYNELTLEPSKEVVEIQEKLGVSEPIKLICSTRLC